jgi:salicylate hydroxylase
MVVYRGLCKTEDIADDWPLDTYATVFMAPGKHFLTFPISSNKIVNIVAFVTTPWEDLGDVKESWTLTSDKSAVEDHFKEFAPAVKTVISKMNTNPLKWILFDREPSPEWVFSGGKVVLLGDAAHAMCPHQGQSSHKLSASILST